MLNKTNNGYYDTLVYLYENKKKNNYTCNDIANIMNEKFSLNNGESKYRKEWNAFNAGRIYEKEYRQKNVYKKILSISDLHIPFNLSLDYLKKYSNNIDVLILNGDIIDHQGISKFSKSYRISPIEDMISCRRVIIQLIEMLSPKEVYINYGNHEKRFSSYLNKNIDCEIIELMPDTALDLICTDGFYHYDKKDRSKIWYEPIENMFEGINVEYTHDWKFKYGKTWFAHPIAYSSSPLKTCEKAMHYFQSIDNKGFDAVVLAHTHRTGDTKEGNIVLYEQGAFCKTEEMGYADGRLTLPQQKGFVVICQDKDGNIIYNQSKRIII